MKKELQEIMNQSTFKLVDGIWVYAKVGSWPKTENHFMISKDKDEITVITNSQNLGQLDLVERNKDDYVLIALNVSVPFYSVGF